MLLTGNPPEELEFALEVALALNPENNATYTMLAMHEYEKDNHAKSRQILEYCWQHVNPRSAQLAYDLARKHIEQRVARQINGVLENMLGCRSF